MLSHQLLSTLILGEASQSVAVWVPSLLQSLLRLVGDVGEMEDSSSKLVLVIGGCAAYALMPVASM